MDRLFESNFSNSDLLPVYQLITNTDSVKILETISTLPTCDFDALHPYILPALIVSKNIAKVSTPKNIDQLISLLTSDNEEIPESIHLILLRSAILQFKDADLFDYGLQLLLATFDTINFGSGRMRGYARFDTLVTRLDTVIDNLQESRPLQKECDLNSIELWTKLYL